MKPNKSLALLVAGAMVGILCCTGCNSQPEPSGTTASGGAAGSTAKLSGALNIDGSSTVYPVAAAMEEDFVKTNPEVKGSCSQAGTGAGFEKFLRKEIDIADASRPITADEDAKLKAAGIQYIEVPIAFDGLSIVVNNKNTWATNLTTAELKKAWEPTSTVKKWSDIRTGFPDKAINFYGPNTSHGTFDYFTEAIIGKKGSQRKDYTMVTEYNQLVQGIQQDEGALGYVGYSYYVQNKDSIRAVPVDNGKGKGPVAPSEATILDGTYSPLSRPLFMYVNKNAYDTKPQLKAFIAYALSAAGVKAVKDNSYVPLPDSDYALVKARVDKETAGSAFLTFKPGDKLSDVLK